MENNAFDAKKGTCEKAYGEEIQEISSHSGKHTREKHVSLLKITRCSRGTHNLKSGGGSKFRKKETKGHSLSGEHKWADKLGHRKNPSKQGACTI